MPNERESPEERRMAFKLVKPENLAVLTDAQAFFDVVVQGLMEDAAAILLNGRNEDEDPLYSEVPSKVNYDELIGILMKRSIPAPAVDQRRTSKERWLVGKIAVKVAVYYRGWTVVAKPAMEEDAFAEGEEYFFDAKKVLSKPGETDIFKGKSFWEVEAILGKRQDAAIAQGRESSGNRDCMIFTEIVRVRTLIHDLLYDLELSEPERIDLAKELITLKLKIGAAAMAVIQDFIFEFTRKNGWMSAIKMQNNTETVEDSDAIYSRTLAERLIVGDFDLRNLIL